MSWGAVIAGAMVALTIYMVLMLLGVAIGIEAAIRGNEVNFGNVGALYTIIVLAVSMFFGGWATTRLAVGEDKVEALLHGLILWGVLFLGLLWLVASGVKTGFSAMIGVASGAYAVTDGEIDVERLAADMKRAGVDESEVDRATAFYRDMRTNPVETLQNVPNDPEARRAASALVDGTRWTLTGVIVSLLLVILGALIGSGDVPVPVPLGLMRRPPARPVA